MTEARELKKQDTVLLTLTGAPYCLVAFFDSATATATRERERALLLRDTLVRFDEESSARTTVIDDQGEYYDLLMANAWMGEDERMEEVRAEEARRATRGRIGTSERGEVRVDLLGRRFYVGKDEDEDKGLVGQLGLLADGILEVAELERPWGGGRGALEIGRGSGEGVGGASEAFVEFLGGRGGGLAGLRFRQ